MNLDFSNGNVSSRAPVSVVIQICSQLKEVLRIFMYIRCCGTTKPPSPGISAWYRMYLFLSLLTCCGTIKPQLMSTCLYTFSGMYRVDQGVCNVNTQSTPDHKLISSLFVCKRIGSFNVVVISDPVMNATAQTCPRYIQDIHHLSQCLVQGKTTSLYSISFECHAICVVSSRVWCNIFPLSVFRVRRRHGRIGSELVHDFVPGHRIDHLQHVQFRRAIPYPIDDVVDTYSRCLAYRGRGRWTRVVMYRQSTY